MKDTRGVLDEARTLATKWSTVIADSISVFQYSMTAENVSDRSRGLRSSVETLLRSNADAEELEKRLSKIHREIRAFRDRLPVGTSEGTPAISNSDILSMIEKSEALMSRLIQPSPPPSRDMAKLLDDCYTPGVMEYLMTLLPSGSAVRVHGLLKGDPNQISGVTNEIQARDALGPQSASAFRCFMAAGYFLSKDISVVADALEATSKCPWPPPFQKTASAIFNILQQSLDVFVEDLEKGKVEQESTPPFAKQVLGKPLRYLRGWVLWVFRRSST
ncbi:hypothetical protein SCHPADRAFT_406240 [Schizopora paradoxa]|uniref:Uncharacterized protein n=1 Tax=Schizopora paradoxa TaxID=27342 RepID=A0A0H2RTA2_9AGAM|nr:hypothetical protein SCHPADRAFT_406240 [Schizopora paradoxa]